MTQNGNPKKHIRLNIGDAYENSAHAFFTVEKDDVIINANQYKHYIRVNVSKILSINIEKEFSYIKEITRYNNTINGWTSTVEYDIYERAILCAIKKSNILRCTYPMYYSKKEA